MSRFYVLQVGSFGQYAYAWYEPSVDANYSEECPCCPVCSRPVGGLYWLPPYDVVLKQPRKVGDFIYGPGGSDLLVTERFLQAYEAEGLSGIERQCPVRVTRMGTTKRAASYPQPSLFGVWFQRGPTRVDYDKMSVVWASPPRRDYCRTCGPGGGDKGGVWRSIRRVVVDATIWDGTDFFYAINFSGSILLSERAREFLDRFGFANCNTIPCEEYSYSFA